MPLEQFSILLDNPSMSYFPGQIVSGRVVATAKTEKNTQGMKLKFEGKATVHWTEEVTEKTDAGDKKVTKSHDDSDSFFEFKSYLLGDGRSDVKLPAGQNSYNFSFQLPMMNIPSSYLGQHGKVEYVLEANIKRSWKFDYNTKQCITVNSIVDLNNNPTASESGEWSTSKTFCCLCCASGPLTLNARMKTKGYCSGEIIPLEVELNNLSTRTITDLSVELVQEANFFAQSDKKPSLKTLVSEKKGEGVDPGDSDIWRVNLHIPSAPPSALGGCRLIDVQYLVKVEAHVSGVAFNLKQSCPIIIGTVPLKARFDELKQSDVIPSAPPLFTPSGYPDLPPPQYQESYNFKLEPEKPDNLVDNIANTVIDQIVPAGEPDFVPNYVTYGWKFNIPEVKAV